MAEVEIHTQHGQSTDTFGQRVGIVVGIIGILLSIVTILDRIPPAVRDMVRGYGLESRCASVRSTGLALLDCERDPDGTVKPRHRGIAGGNRG